MYAPKIQHKSPKDLFLLWFTDGESTSIVINGETFMLTVSDGQAFLSPNHTTAWRGSEAVSNIIGGAPALSVHNFQNGCYKLWEMFSVPDTLITSSDPVMIQKAREVIQYFEVKSGWRINHVVCPALKDQKRWRWFIADSRKAAGHYKKLPLGFSEIAMLNFDWIVVSLSNTCPVLS